MGSLPACAISILGHTSCFHPVLTEALGVNAVYRLVHHEGLSVRSLKGEAEERACSAMVRLACDTDSPWASSCWAFWVPCAKCSPPISSGVEWIRTPGCWLVMEGSPVEGCRNSLRRDLWVSKLATCRDGYFWSAPCRHPSQYPLIPCPHYLACCLLPSTRTVWSWLAGLSSTMHSRSLSLFLVLAQVGCR